MPAPVSALSLCDSDKQQIQQWASAFGTPQQVVLRCRIVLAAASGQSDNSIAEQLQINRKTVMLWRARMAQQGLKSLWEIAPGRGRKSTYGQEKIQEIIDTTLQSKPKARTQWSCRSLAKRLGVSKSTVSNIWRSHNLKPHRVKTFKLSRDPHFLEKFRRFQLRARLGRPWLTDGWPGAVIRPRLPQNVACRFSALRSSEVVSQRCG